MTISSCAPRGVTTRRRVGFLALSMLVSGAVLTLVSLPPVEAATPAIQLGTSGAFAVLAGSGITNTGATSIDGDVGTFPTASITGFNSVTLDGVNHSGDAVTQQAKDDLTTAYNQAAGSGPTTAVATELGGTTLTPGVYGSDTLGITGTLTLNTLGDPQAVFVFQAATTLTTATDSAVVVLGGGEACNVYWQIGSSATLGTRSHLIGSVLAATSITATTGATVEGRLLASSGAVTLDHNTLTRATCTAATTTTETGESTTTTETGESTPTVPTTNGSSAPTPTASRPGAPTNRATTGGGLAAPPTSAVGTPETSAPPTTVPTGPRAPRLPYTGSEAGSLVAMGLVILGLGVGSRAWARRRHASFDA